MTKKTLASGVVHTAPSDMHKALLADQSALERWEDLTPLARNEWICWCISTKKTETRKMHIKRTLTELLQGKRRPCCWTGCMHRAKEAK